MFSGERPFKCPFEGCGRSFTTSNIRKVHIRTHTGERPYYCTEPGCGRAFASATNYKNHVRIHTGNSLWFILVLVFCLSRLSLTPDFHQPFPSNLFPPCCHLAWCIGIKQFKKLHLSIYAFIYSTNSYWASALCSPVRHQRYRGRWDAINSSWVGER